MAKASTAVPQVEITRYESLPKVLKVICLVLSTIGSVLRKCLCLHRIELLLPGYIYTPGGDFY